MTHHHRVSHSHHYRFEAIGTQWSIDFDRSIADTYADETLRRIRQRIEDFDVTYSRFRKDSIVYRASHASGTYVLDDNAAPMMDIYKKLYDLTDGAMTPLIGNLLESYGYDRTYSFEARTPSTVARWDDTMTYHHPELTVHHPVTLDFGAAGKGYLVDLVAELLEAVTPTWYVIDAGGDIRQRGVSADFDRIGLEHPSDSNSAIGVASIGNRSLCGSSGNRRAWTTMLDGAHSNVHHIMDPRTLRSTQSISAVWTVADTTLEADALSTALFLVDPTTLTPHFDFEYAILCDPRLSATSSTLIRSPNFPATFFTA